MSDDYYDDDSHSGGLWDPDAYAPPPTQGRPTLRVIESTDHDTWLLPQGLVEGSGESLVRLDQFRPVDPNESSSDGRPHRRRAAAVAAAALVLAAITVAAVTLSTDGSNHAPPTTASRLSTDTEQAALARNVAPHPTATKHRRRTYRPAPRTKPRAKSHATTPTTTQVRSTPSATSQQPSQPTVASKPKPKARQYDAVSSDTTTPELTQPVGASSEFGFEGSG
jgi:hypothetical protein